MQKRWLYLGAGIAIALLIAVAGYVWLRKPEQGKPPSRAFVEKVRRENPIVPVPDVTAMREGPIASTADGQVSPPWRWTSDCGPGNQCNQRLVNVLSGETAMIGETPQVGWELSGNGLEVRRTAATNANTPQQ